MLCQHDASDVLSYNSEVGVAEQFTEVRNRLRSYTLTNRQLRMRQRLSSLPLQVTLYFNGWYLALLYLAELAIIIYKAIVLPYPARNLGAEIVLLFFLALIDAVRIFLGAKGNLTERRLALLLSLLFILPVFFGYLYLTLWQTYVLRVDLILLIIAFVGLALELLFGIIALWTFQRSDSLR